MKIIGNSMDEDSNKNNGMDSCGIWARVNFFILKGMKICTMQKLNETGHPQLEFLPLKRVSECIFVAGFHTDCTATLLYFTLVNFLWCLLFYI